MPSTLVGYRARILDRLVDAGGNIFSTATLDEAIRTALDEYNRVYPLTAETVIVLPGAGREIALANVTGLIGVSEVWWPYDSLSEVWPPNQVQGFRIFWDDAQPVLFLTTRDGSQPQLDDEVRLWYTKLHTIQDLDSAAVTTVHLDHETDVVAGGAGHAAIAESLDQIGQVHIDPKEVEYLRSWGISRLNEYRAALNRIRDATVHTGEPWGAPWKLDKWDT